LYEQHKKGYLRASRTINKIVKDQGFWWEAKVVIVWKRVAGVEEMVVKEP
jgi:hypothetical protein